MMSKKKKKKGQTAKKRCEDKKESIKQYKKGKYVVN